MVLDDFRKPRPGDSGSWQHEAFVTFKYYKRMTLSSLVIPEDELEASRHYVLARLLATWLANVGTERSAFDCDFSRSTQHTIDAQAEGVLHGTQTSAAPY